MFRSIFLLYLTLALPAAPVVEGAEGHPDCQASYGEISAEAAHPLSRLSASAPLDPAKGEIYYAVYGAENRETLVLIHGANSSSKTFDPIIPELSKKYRVIVYDQRGHGRSAARGVNYTTGILAQDLKGLLDYLHVRDAHLLGHSLGGRTAARFAELFPGRVKSVLIEDMDLSSRVKVSAKKLQEKQDIADQMEASLEGRTFPDRKALEAALSPFFGDEAKDLAKRRSVRNPDGTYSLDFHPGVNMRFGYQTNAEDLHDALASSGRPTLFIGADPAKGGMLGPDGIQKISQQVPNARVSAIPGSGHSIHRTHTAQFLRDATDFFVEADRKAVTHDLPVVQNGFTGSQFEYKVMLPSDGHPAPPRVARLASKVKYREIALHADPPLLWENPRFLDLTPGAYTYVLLKDGTWVVGKVTDSWELGVKHIQLANQRPVVAAGELSISGDGKVVFNLQSGSFTKRFPSQHRNEVLPGVVGELFKGEFAGRPVEYGGSKSVEPGTILPQSPPSWERIDIWCLDFNFREGNPELCSH